jgi:hypothetical protein
VTTDPFGTSQFLRLLWVFGHSTGEGSRDSGPLSGRWFLVLRGERNLGKVVYATMERGLKQQWREFKAIPPGKRFQARFERSKGSKRASLAGRVVRIVVAVVAFVLGIIFSLLPIIPGFVFFFITASILAAESFRVARFLDRCEVKLRSGFAAIRRRYRARAVAGRHP